MGITIDRVMDLIEEYINGDAFRLDDLLNEAGIRTLPTSNNYVRMECKTCESAKVYMQVKGGQRIRWRCEKCDSAKTYFNNLGGLVRFYKGAHIKPFDAAYVLFDIAYKIGPHKTSDIQFPINLGGLKGKYLHECPPRSILYAAEGAEAPIDESVKRQMVDFILKQESIPF